MFADGMKEAVALAELLHAPVANSYLHNDTFPASHPLWCGPLGYQGSKAAMKLISQADVVLALGSRLGPFGTLAQYGLDYWPKNAKIIQIDTDAKMLGLVKPISVGICGDAKAAAHALVRRLARKDTGLPAEQSGTRRQDQGRENRVGRRSWTSGRTRPIRTRSRFQGIQAICIRARCCANWSARCRSGQWCRPTSATSARYRTRICVLRNRAQCWRR